MPPAACRADAPPRRPRAGGRGTRTAPSGRSRDRRARGRADGVDDPSTASMCQSAGRENLQEEPSTMTISMIGLDTAKTAFQVHGIDEAGKATLKRKLHRGGMVA